MTRDESTGLDFKRTTAPGSDRLSCTPLAIYVCLGLPERTVRTRRVYWLMGMFQRSHVPLVRAVHTRFTFRPRLYLILWGFIVLGRRVYATLPHQAALKRLGRPCPVSFPGLQSPSPLVHAGIGVYYCGTQKCSEAPDFLRGALTPARYTLERGAVCYCIKQYSSRKADKQGRGSTCCIRHRCQTNTV